MGATSPPGAAFPAARFRVGDRKPARRTGAGPVHPAGGVRPHAGARPAVAWASRRRQVDAATLPSRHRPYQRRAVGRNGVRGSMPARPPDGKRKRGRRLVPPPAALIPLREPARRFVEGPPPPTGLAGARRFRRVDAPKATTPDPERPADGGSARSPRTGPDALRAGGRPPRASPGSLAALGRTPAGVAAGPSWCRARVGVEPT